MQQPRGKALLLVTGILYLPLAAIILLAGAGLLFGGGDLAYWNERAGRFVVLMALGVLLFGALQLAAGIHGVKYRDRPERARTCFVLGAVLLAMGVLDLAFALYLGRVGAPLILSDILLPGFYMLGAWRNRVSVPAAAD